MYATLKKAQPRVLQIIENSKKSDRLSHAYLFTGPKGTYKKEMAFYFAMMLYCKEEHPCGTCEECRAILENRHLNVTYIEPFGQSIKKEQIIALQEEFSKTSLVEGPRVYIINEADTMSASAANSLLKFIEEPNGETYGILITEHKDNILSTIISRSVVINFSELDKAILKEQLKELNINELNENSLNYLTSNIMDAKELLNNEAFNKVLEVFNNFVTELSNKGNIGLFYKNNIDVLGNKENLKLFLSLLEAFFRDTYEYQLSKQIIVFSALLNEIEIVASKFEKDEILTHLFSVLELNKKLGYNVNMSLLINQFLIDLNGGI